MHIEQNYITLTPVAYRQDSSPFNQLSLNKQ